MQAITCTDIYKASLAMNSTAIAQQVQDFFQGTVSVPVEIKMYVLKTEQVITNVIFKLVYKWHCHCCILLQIIRIIHMTIWIKFS